MRTFPRSLLLGHEFGKIAVRNCPSAIIPYSTSAGTPVEVPRGYVSRTKQNSPGFAARYDSISRHSAPSEDSRRFTLLEITAVLGTG